MGPLLLAVGAGLLAAWGLTLAAGEIGQSDAERRWEQSIDAQGARPMVPPPPELARPLDRIDFRLRIPKLRYRAIVREGVGDDVLFAGPGHYSETRWPGQGGNVGVASHNVYWLRFDQIAPGDEIILDTRYGSFHYRVTGAEVVSPDDRTVLADVPGRHLTLTTCWPLWAGQFASRRLAIYAA
jgi:sortase A